MFPCPGLQATAKELLAPLVEQLHRDLGAAAAAGSARLSKVQLSHVLWAVAVPAGLSLPRSAADLWAQPAASQVRLQSLILCRHTRHRCSGSWAC